MVRPPETFATERLIARPPRVEDAEAVFAAYASDPVVTRYLSWRNYSDVEPVRAFLRGVARTWGAGEMNGHFAWMLCRRGTDTPIGSIGINVDRHSALTGYVLGRSHWGQGLMTEALMYIAAWALAQPQLHRIWAFCDVENPASVRVLEKAGMQCEGLLRRWQVCPNIGPEPRDCLVYAKIR
jgi:RimJ/RimL family protein N-acetyltransferase